MDHSHLQPRHRRSSVAEAFNSLRSAGGPNSIENFARSWQRAAGFSEVLPVRRSFVYTDSSVDGDDDGESQRGEVDASPISHRSLLREQLAQHRGPNEALVEEGDEPSVQQQTGPRDRLASEQSPLLREQSSRRSIFDIQPQLASPFGRSYGTSWSTVASGGGANEPSMRHPSRLSRQPLTKAASEEDKEHEPLLFKHVHDTDGKVVNVVVGQSTLPQTTFNLTNVLSGVGILALPLAMHRSGWAIGQIFLLYAAITTQYTAKLLAKCASTDSSIVTYSDLAFAAFGFKARIVTSSLLMFELIGANTGLVILFADSMNALVPRFDITTWKIIAGFILTPLTFIPLRVLAYTSFLGVGCTLAIMVTILGDGAWKPHHPGSLREPAVTHIMPTNWLAVPIAFGLLMSPWGGHSVFPTIYKDMRHPHKYPRAVNMTYIFTYILDFATSVVGYLMYGSQVRDEITKNIILDNGNPVWTKVFVIVCIAVVAITKVPLNSRPVADAGELCCAIDHRSLTEMEEQGRPANKFTVNALKICIRIFINVLYVILAITVQEFDRIMALLGSVACFSICQILPCAIYLKMLGHGLGRAEKGFNWWIIVSGSVLAVVSTVFSCIPNDKLGLQ